MGTDQSTYPFSQSEVEAELNKLSTAAVGVTVETKYLTADAMRLWLSAANPYDIAFTSSWFNDYASQASAGYFTDLTDKLPAIAPDLYNFIPPLIWQGSNVNGRIYAIPTLKDNASSQFWVIDKAKADALNIDMSSLTTWDSIEPVLAAAKAAALDTYPLMLNKSGLSGLTAMFDSFNPDLNIGVPYANNDSKVVSFLTDNDFLQRLTTLHEWYAKGYINPDAATLDLPPDDTVVTSAQGYPGADAIWAAQQGHAVVSSQYYGPTLSTDSVRGSMTAISASSENIDKALEYLQYANLNHEYRDMLAYGIEGVHYWINDQGTVERVNRDYAPWSFSQATFYTMTPMFPAPKDIAESYKEMNDTAIATNALGFAFDTTSVDEQVTACTILMREAAPALFTGTADPAVAVPKLLDDLNAAGYQEIIAECQRQLDAFLAANPAQTN